jgi:hypothetical protein
LSFSSSWMQPFIMVERPNLKVWPAMATIVAL